MPCTNELSRDGKCKTPVNEWASPLGAFPLSTFQSPPPATACSLVCRIATYFSHHWKKTVMKNTRQGLSHFTNTRPTKWIVWASAVKGVVAYDRGDLVVFPRLKCISFAFVELVCLIPNFRGSALSSPQSPGVSMATRKPLAAGTTVLQRPWPWRKGLRAQPSSAFTPC